MPTKNYSLGPESSGALQISWESSLLGSWKNLMVKTNGAAIGSISTEEELKTGKTFSLPDGSELKVQLQKKFFGTDLHLLRNNKPVIGSGADPRTHWRQAYQIIFFVAAVNFILGVATLFFKIGYFEGNEAAVGLMMAGIIYFVLAFFVKRLSLVALVIAIVLFVVDSIFSARTGLIITVRLIILIGMIRGISTIRQLRREAPPKA